LKSRQVGTSGAADFTLEKTLPNSVESERAVLGAIILDEKTVFAATEVLTADDFYLEAHRGIFRAMLSLIEEEISIDLITLREELRRRDKEESDSGVLWGVALRLICILVCDSESIGRERIAVETGMSKPTVYRHIDTLLKGRRIKMNGNVYEVSFDD
jgi:replicative DNA helicase